MKKNSVTFGLIGILIGLAIGFSVANYFNRNAPKPTGQIAQNSPNAQTSNQQGQINPTAQMPDIQLVLDKAKNEPKNLDAQLKAGEMYSKIQRFDKALEYYEKAQQIKPDDAKLNMKLGNAYFDTKKYLQAAEFYTKVLKVDPKNISARTDLGLTFFLRDPSDNDRAIAEYRKSLAINPNHELTLQNLSVVLKEKEDQEELEKTLERLKKVNPQNIVLEKLNASVKK